MPDRWKQHKVRDLIANGKLVIGDGYRAKNEELSKKGLPFARAGNINDGFHFVDADHLPEQHLHRVGNKISQPGDVVFTSKGTVGRFAFVRAETPKFVYSPQLCFWRSTDLDVLDPRFLYFWMSGNEFFVQFTGVAGQTDMAEYVSLTDQRRMFITLPSDIAEQRAIAGVLGALDDKIESNRRTSRTLERVARAIFRAWFVEFEPVKAKAAELICDGVLEIGDGYRAKNSEIGESGLPFIRAGNLNNGFDTARAERLCEESVAKAGRKASLVGDIAFTSKGTIGRFARVTAHTERFVYSPQICYWRSLDPSRLHPAILYCWMRDDDFAAQIASVSGQTDMAPYVSLKDQRQMSVPVFPSSQHTVAPKIEALLARQSAAIQESKILAKVRDYLLPKLLSGEVRVAEGSVCSILESTAASRKRRRGHV